MGLELVSDEWLQTFPTGAASVQTSQPCDVSTKRPCGFAPWPPKGETMFEFEIEFDLSPREIEVMQRYDEHLSTQEIADRLYISTHTVRSHVKHVLAKVGVHSRAEALRALRDRGLLTRAAA